MRSYVEILENIRDTQCKLEEVPQNEYEKVSAGVTYGHIMVLEGYLFLTPVGRRYISNFCSTKETKKEAEGLEKEVLALQRKDNRSEVILALSMTGLGILVVLIPFFIIMWCNGGF